jgi:dTDP-4-dehydrorhamnose 3,5-epimerase
VFYSITTPYHAESLRGARWDDPRFSIQWPLASEARLNERDASYPHFVPSGA